MCNNSSENTAIYFPVNKKDQSQEIILDGWKKALHDWNWKHVQDAIGLISLRQQTRVKKPTEDN